MGFRGFWGVRYLNSDRESVPIVDYWKSDRDGNAISMLDKL